MTRVKTLLDEIFFSRCYRKSLPSTRKSLLLWIRYLSSRLQEQGRILSMELRPGKVPSKNMKNIPLSGIKYFRSPFRKQEHTPSSGLSLEETPSKNRKEHIPHSRISLEKIPPKNMK
ncbi:hypothetical protein HanRHA438_Chr13g0616261 [Helianthus annuus]|nr:hypothetical protein HanRHA438_Chr13g0616261 [Helianthus annuus]